MTLLQTFSLLFISETSLGIIYTVIIVCFLIAWLRTVYEINKSSFATNDRGTFWLLFVTFMPIIGMIFYFALGRKQRV